MNAIDQDLVVQIVDAINELAGRHPGARAAHAKGTWCRGIFTPSAEAAQLSRAQHFRQPVSALVRFSNGSGDPRVPDSHPDGRGMAVKFDPPDGGQTDIVALTLPVFFVRTPEDFLAFTRARRPDPATGRPDDAAVGQFIAEHPESLPAVQAFLSLGIPASYAQCTYHSIHAFRFVDAAGAQRHVRYRWSPAAGEARIDPEDARSRSEDYLRTELAERLAAGPAAFTLDVAIAADGDAVDDPTAQWPDDRPRVVLGQLEITTMAEDPEAGGGLVVFDPTNVTDGIELTDDPILHTRRAAYSESVNRRAS
jgi:catalase